MLSILNSKELKLLVKRVGIRFCVVEKELTRDDYEVVLDEAYAEDFMKEYNKIIRLRKNRI